MSRMSKSETIALNVRIETKAFVEKSETKARVLHFVRIARETAYRRSRNDRRNYG